MKKKLLLFITALLFAGTVNAQGNYWGNDPDSHAQPSNTPIVASVTIDGEAVEASDAMRLGAFVGDELRGIAAPHDDGNFWIQVFYAETTDNITFKFYNGSDEFATCETTLAGSDEGYGTPTTPEVLNFTNGQTVELDAGWNWWSTPIEITDGEAALTMLENSLGENGVYITTQGTNVENYYSQLGYNYWWGNLTEIQNEFGYKLMVSSDCSVTMTGNMAQPENHPITIQPNWNWIGYPCSSSQLIANADFQPSNEDLIQTQGASSTFYEGYGWWPDFTMEAGKGYLYYSTASVDKTMTFTNSNSRGEYYSIKNNRYWSNDNHAYPDNIVVIASVYLNGEELKDDNIEVGAFVDSENRGSSKLMYFQPLDRYFILFTIAGQSGDFIEFKMIDTRTEEENADCNTHFTFEPYSRYGSLDKPVELHFGSNADSNRVVSLFPNPVNRNKSFSIDLPYEETINGFFIFDELGSTIRHEEGRIDMSNIKGLPVAGYYTIKVVCKSGNVYYSKLIVK